MEWLVAASLAVGVWLLARLLQRRGARAPALQTTGELSPHSTGDEDAFADDAAAALALAVLWSDGETEPSDADTHLPAEHPYADDCDDFDADDCDDSDPDGCDDFDPDNL